MSLQIAQCGGEAQLVETQWTEQTLTATLCSALGLDLVVCGWFLPGGRTGLGRAGLLGTGQIPKIIHLLLLLLSLTSQGHLHLHCIVGIFILFH